MSYSERQARRDRFLNVQNPTKWAKRHIEEVLKALGKGQFQLAQQQLVSAGLSIERALTKINEYTEKNLEMEE